MTNPFLTERPDHVAEGCSIPTVERQARIKILATNSAELKKGNDKFIKGASAGDLVNTATRIVLGDSVFVTPLFMTEHYATWNAALGRLFGNFASVEEAVSKIAEVAPETTYTVNEGRKPNMVQFVSGKAPVEGDKAEYEICKTRTYAVVVYDSATFEPMEKHALIDFSKSNLFEEEYLRNKIAAQGTEPHTQVWEIGSYLVEVGANSWFKWNGNGAEFKGFLPENLLTHSSSLLEVAQKDVPLLNAA